MASTTTNRAYPLPNGGDPVTTDTNDISDDLAVFQNALIAIDADVAALISGLAGKAATSHPHAIGDVTGLQTALNGKSATDHAHKLDDLTDVSGADAAPTTGGYALIKTVSGWVPQQVASLLGTHSHTASDITDLSSVLSAYATPAYVNAQIAATVNSAPTTLDTLNELAAALGDDPNFATTITALIGTKLASASYTATDVLTKIKTVDGAGSGLDADLLDGQSSAYFLPVASYTAADVLAKLLTVDTNTSGLNANTLQGSALAQVIAAAGYAPYSGSDANNLTFPVGTILFVSIGTETPNRNATTAPRLTQSGTVGYILSGTGSLLSGTWVSRGIAATSSSIVERIA